MSALHKLMARIEQTEALDKVAQPVAGLVGRIVKPRPIRNILSGSYLGHPLHPLMTDLPIGAWTMATLLDTVGGRRAEPAADLLVTAGILTAAPTAWAGLNDWSDTQGGDRRVGIVHAAANATALVCFTASLVARRSGRRRVAKVIALGGFGLLMSGGYLGGHLSYSRGVNINHTAWREGPAEWTSVLAASELTDDMPQLVQVGDLSLVLYRSGGTLRALDSVCSHMGGPLDEGTVDDGCVTCPWHGSTFRLADGSVVRGPASSEQPAYETRVREGHIEVRRR
ncbi:Rieske (2Fe-2S) protein [Arthrobacter sulfonylureivorans]|uniref:Rieske (2Fe-2S) protein n=1 Tax=Arthrobacter sulfonylureivorans TaxID=2486855 RepID=A0ABY3WDG5_9MICC|nr:Rieske (2Fe-2S) protein [Arthrobacter sulfonylureivorans]UNK47253.1 Rieske (2Fe-2S) protein [Arthrobacter sulfonylureivorans]